MAADWFGQRPRREFTAERLIKPCCEGHGEAISARKNSYRSLMCKYCCCEIVAGALSLSVGLVRGREFASVQLRLKRQADSSAAAFLPFDYYNGSNLVYSSLLHYLYRNVASWCLRIHTPSPSSQRSSARASSYSSPRIVTVTQLWRRCRAQRREASGCPRC
jgi:hypothetical protein